MDGPVGVRACGWACGRAGVWMGMQPCGHADVDGCKQKEKRKKKKKKKLTNWFQVCGWACGRASVQMGMQLCGHVDADGCEQKERRKKRKRKRKNLLIGSKHADGRADVWACGRAEADDCKKRKKERKRKDSLVFRAGGWVCGRVADGCAWMHLWADVNGCKQKEKRKGGRKEKKEGLTAGSGHECAVRTLPNKDKLFEQCSNSTPLHGGLFKHCSNTWTGSITCPNTVQSVRTLPNKDKLFE